MGILNLFKKKEKLSLPQRKETTETTEKEKISFNPNPCYLNAIAKETSLVREVVTFEDRKKTAIPSSRGLYPAEILLLEYCSKGIYPQPQNGYPRFWWSTYGIHDVEAVLKTLEERGFITFTSAANSVKSFTVQQLKDLLASKGYITAGKKDELIARVIEKFSEEDLLAEGIQVKYALTEIGQQELDENAYVSYMHSINTKTTEDTCYGMTFNVWSINKLLGTGDKSNWKTVVEEQERKLNSEIADRNDSFMKDLQKINSESYKTLKMQDQQISAVQKAREKYDKDKDLDSYIAFWEMIWESGGLKFEGIKWHFELPDLYIKAKRYNDALAFVTRLKNIKPAYSYKSDAYIKRIEELKAKRASKNKND